MLHTPNVKKKKSLTNVYNYGMRKQGVMQLSEQVTFPATIA